MSVVVTATFQSVAYVACYIGRAEPFKQQIDVGLIGFRRNNEKFPVVVFPDDAAAQSWGKIWFKRNKRVMPSLSPSFFNIVPVTLGVV